MTPIGCQSILKSGKAKLGVGVHSRFFKDTFSGMEELANERVVEPRLPLLYEGEFKAAIVGTTNKKRDWGPNIEVLMFTPESEG